MNKRFLSVVAATVFGLGVAASAFAATPTLGIYPAGGDSVIINVNGDPNATVVLYYNVGATTGVATSILGTTDGNGFLTKTLSASSLSLNTSLSVYVVVNNQQSTSRTWSGSSSSAATVPVLSQTSVTLAPNQATTITAQGATTGIYMLSNSNQAVASVATNGSTQVTVTGTQTGSTSIVFCFVGSSSNCATLTVNVQGSGSTQGVSFSQNPVSLPLNQGQVITITGGNGAYSVSSNSNASIISASISGSGLTLYSANPGTASISVCDSNSSCGTLTVTAGSSSTGTTSGGISFSLANPTIGVNQSQTVTINGGSSFYVSTNSNLGITRHVLNGNAITITGVANGSTVLTICSLDNVCAALPVTVGSGTGSTSSTGSTNTTGVTLSTVNTTIGVGQNTTVSASGATTYFVSANTNPVVVQATINGNVLTITGVASGSTNITVCGTSGGCATVAVTVNATATTTPAPTTTTTTPAPTTVTTPSNPSTLLAEIQSMQTQLVQMVLAIQGIQTRLTQLVAAVAPTTPISSPSVSASTGGTFSSLLTLDSSGAEVTALQQKLTALGYYSGPVTGYFGPLTEAAVKKFQSAKGIDPAGYTGPSTRAALNGQ